MHDIVIYPTHIDDFSSCGHLFELEKVLKMPRKLNPYLPLGQSVDEAITANLTSMRDAGRPLPRDEYLKIFEESWFSAHGKGQIPYEEHGMTKEDMHERGLACINLHYDKVAPKTTPQYIQQFFRLDIGDGIALAGKVDFTDVAGVIHDTKVSKDRKKPSDLPKTQAIFYTLCVHYGNPQQDVTGFQLDYLVWGGGEPYYDPRTITVTQKDIDFMLDDARRFAAARRAGIFPRNGRGTWKCSKKWCGQWDNCLGAELPIEMGETR